MFAGIVTVYKRQKTKTANAAIGKKPVFYPISGFLLQQVNAEGVLWGYGRAGEARKKKRGGLGRLLKKEGLEVSK